jgi:hypothetical protein
MANDLFTRSFTVVQSRPPSLREWSDLNDLLDDHANRLHAALGMGWDVEGPLFEAGELRIDLSREIERTPDDKFRLAISIGHEPAPGDAPEPPEMLPLQVDVSEDRWRPASETSAGLTTGAIFAAATAIGYGILRLSHSWTWAVLAGLAALVPLLIVAVVAQDRIQRLRRRRQREPQPSPELLDTVAVVERYLRASFGEVHPG